MRNKRISALFLSLVMALSATAITGGAVSADYDEHPNLPITIALGQMEIDEATGALKKANEARRLTREIRHLRREHHDSSNMRWLPNDCVDDVHALARAGQFYARQAFRFYRGKYTDWNEFYGWEKRAMKARAWLTYDRSVDRLGDRMDDFLDCVYLEAPRRIRFLFD